MEPTEVIKPADVYTQVLLMKAEIAAMHSAIAVLGWIAGVQVMTTVLQIVAKLIILGRVLRQGERTDKLLTLIEGHGNDTDKTVERFDKAAEDVRRSVQPVAEVAPAVQEVAKKVDELPVRVRDAITGNDSGVIR